MHTVRSRTQEGKAGDKAIWDISAGKWSVLPRIAFRRRLKMMGKRGKLAESRGWKARERY